jgi:hypothetical protein
MVLRRSEGVTVHVYAVLSECDDRIGQMTGRRLRWQILMRVLVPSFHVITIELLHREGEDGINRDTGASETTEIAVINLNG